MKLNVTETTALFDQPMAIAIDGLPSRGRVEAQASMRYPWAPNVLFESHATFTADQVGSLDLAEVAPDSGSYDYPGSMGLVESLAATEGNIAEIAEHMDVDRPIMIDLRFACGTDTATARLERRLIAPGVSRQPLADGLVGELFLSASPSDTTVVVLGGSDGNLGAILPIASALASHGVNALALAYFNQPSLPSGLLRVPLEYFGHAFDWLERHHVTQGTRLCLHGTSKGGELALLLAARDPR
ncbi:MAG: acyl-CoA thioesterase/BAAT N-terminal domain-containing protein, partial [Micrococcales bacterium]|nr:acyl-CoA thioesterase/BAAT N-terminal domain-containing protein [Micrococcales bacterium]